MPKLQNSSLNLAQAYGLDSQILWQQPGEDERQARRKQKETQKPALLTS